MPRTTVVRVERKQPFDVYMGRGGPFGNPFVIGPDGDRAEVIRKFRVHFYERLKIDPAWKKLVEGLRGKRLACHCAPLPCHVDVYIEYLESPGLPKDRMGPSEGLDGGSSPPWGTM